jgi:N-acyl-D-amino-acid deacylase
VSDAFGLCDRGYLRVGRRADLTLVDLERFKPMADYERPAEFATGVVHLLVNGIQVIGEGEYTGALPGRIVNRQALSCGE